MEIHSLPLSSLLLAGLFLSAAVPIARGAEPNDTFATRTVLPAGIASVSDTITGGSGQPDTVLGAFDATSTSLVVPYNDDGGPFADFFASALYNVPVNGDGSINLKITGWDDFDFDGNSDVYSPGNPHQSEGDMQVSVRVYNSSHTLIASLQQNYILAPGEVKTYSFSSGSYIGGTFDVEINNTIDPIDYWEFNGFEPNSTVTAEVTCCAGGNGGFDSFLGWYDSNGMLIATDDDGGTIQLLSKITDTASAEGKVIIAVTGVQLADLSPYTSHKENGSYTLQLTGTQTGGQPNGDCAPLGNPDGFVNAADYLVATRIALGLISPQPQPQDLFPCDLYPPGSPDGAITASDLILLSKQILTTP